MAGVSLGLLLSALGSCGERVVFGIEQEMISRSWLKYPSSTFLWLIALSLFATRALATPVHPNMRELLKQPAPEQRPAPAARAGWNGPEMETPSEVEGLTGASPAEAEREARASLKEVATPDWEVVLGLAAFIVLVRALRKRVERKALREATLVSAADSNKEPNAMRPAA
jgi:hypothetical protein